MPCAVVTLFVPLTVVLPAFAWLSPKAATVAPFSVSLHVTPKRPLPAQFAAIVDVSSVMLPTEVYASLAASGEMTIEPPTSVVPLPIVSLKWTPVASVPLLVIVVE